MFLFQVGLLIRFAVLTPSLFSSGVCKPDRKELSVSSGRSSFSPSFLNPPPLSSHFPLGSRFGIGWLGIGGNDRYGTGVDDEVWRGVGWGLGWGYGEEGKGGGGVHGGDLGDGI